VGKRKKQRERKKERGDERRIKKGGFSN